MKSYNRAIDRVGQLIKKKLRSTTRQPNCMASGSAVDATAAANSGGAAGGDGGTGTTTSGIAPDYS